MSVEKSNWQTQVIHILNTLPFKKFENFCGLFLEELSLKAIKIKGIEQENTVLGKGTIELGILTYYFDILIIRSKEKIPLLILSKIREQMTSQTNKGLIITTSRFSREVKKEAKKKGKIPIDLIDGEDLVNRLYKSKLGIYKREDKKIEITYNWFNKL